jgi:oligopeptide transport system substrate-binding protein
MKLRLSFFFILGFLCSGCFKSSPSAPDPSLLRIQLQSEPVSLDPTWVEDGTALLIRSNLDDGLMGYNGSGKLEKRLAESIQVSSDGKRYELTLRPQVQWSDGKPIQIQDFIVAFRRLLGPKSTSKFAYLFMPIRGALAYSKKQGSFDQVGVREEHGKLVIELEHRVPYFLELLTLPTVLPLRQEVLDQHQGAWPETAPVTGPYELTAHLLNQKISLKRNPNYWGVPPKLEKIDLIFVADESTATHLFETGKVDLLTRVATLDFSRLKQAGKIRTTPFLATYYLAFNCKKFPSNQRDWRRAVAGVIQKNEITQILASGELPARSWIPLGLEGYLPYQNQEKEYLNSIQWAKGKEMQWKVVDAAFDSSARNSKILEKVQQDVSRRLGFRLNLNPYDWKTYIQKIQTDPPPIFRFGWMAPFHDSITHLKVFTTGNRNNYTGYSNLRYDSLVREIESLPLGKMRETKILEAQNIILEDAIVIPIYHYVQNTAVADRVKGFQSNPFGVIPFQHLSVE